MASNYNFVANFDSDDELSPPVFSMYRSRLDRSRLSSTAVRRLVAAEEEERAEEDGEEKDYSFQSASVIDCDASDVAPNNTRLLEDDGLTWSMNEGPSSGDEEEGFGTTVTLQQRQTIPRVILPQLNTPRTIYLITYSQADVLKVSSRPQFAKMISEAFDRKNKKKVVVQWVVCTELHATEGVHYHMAIKLNTPRRWRQVQLDFKRLYDIKLDFLDFHDTYYDAFKYVVKRDINHYETSPGHPELDNRPPQTSAAINAKRVQEVAEGGRKARAPKRRKRLDNAEIFHIVVKNNVRTDDELSMFAIRQMREGNDELNRWVMNHPSTKTREDILCTAWKMADAEKNLERGEKSRMQLLRDAERSPHRFDEETQIQCTGEWLPAALEVLQLNGVAVDFWAKAVRTALEKGRGKGRNMMIIGGTNCAKSFMFLPMQHIYDTFNTPAASSFNWVGAPDKELILLNDVRYGGNGQGDKNFMPWHILLNLLEGAPIDVPMPKNHFAKNVVWKKRQPIFATAEQTITRIVNNKIDAGETSQMDERWVHIKFTHRFKQGDINYNLVHCPRCFAELILNN